MDPILIDLITEYINIFQALCVCPTSVRSGRKPEKSKKNINQLTTDKKLYFTHACEPAEIGQAYRTKSLFHSHQNFQSFLEHYISLRSYTSVLSIYYQVGTICLHAQCTVYTVIVCLCQTLHFHHHMWLLCPHSKLSVHFHSNCLGLYNSNSISLISFLCSGQQRK